LSAFRICILSGPGIICPEVPASYRRLNVSAQSVEDAITSFHKGSSCGPPRLNPDHLRDALETPPETREGLLNAIAILATKALDGKILAELDKCIAGANLIPLDKPGGGIRPIAVVEV
jgi:hypothetical protein